MKKTIQSAIALALLCGYAGAIGIDWGVDNLYLPGTPDALASSTTYGTGAGNYILQLVYVGDGGMTTGGDGVSRYNTFTVVDTGSPATVPFEVPGSVSGSADVDVAGTYVMLLYNNNGGYYSLSSVQNGQTAVSPASYSVTTADLQNPTKDHTYTVTSGNVYKGELVPEPSTTALALAGVALLFRRRRA